MTDEELNKMIGEFLPYPAEGQHFSLKQFAKLVAAAEREACAALCFQMWNDSLDRRKLNHPDAEDCAAAIRARGDALTRLNKAAEDNGEEL